MALLTGAMVDGIVNKTPFQFGDVLALDPMHPSNHLVSFPNPRRWLYLGRIASGDLHELLSLTPDTWLIADGDPLVIQWADSMMAALALVDRMTPIRWGP